MIQLVVPGAALSPSPSGPASATASCCLFELPTAGRKRRMDGLTGGTGGSFIFVLYSVCPMTRLDDRRGSGRWEGREGGWQGMSGYGYRLRTGRTKSRSVRYDPI